MFALIDGNNFFCSCERVFQPGLNGRPLVVLSNNDGCAIARSDEAKSLGIPMGAPYFRIRHLEKDAGLVALSANFALYGDMSARMMALAAEMGQAQEIYSIDESFIDLKDTPDATARAQATREKIRQWTGLPTCVGLGATKTLAKLANHIAKSADRNPGSYPARLAQVCNLTALNPRQLRMLLEATRVGDVWGIGRATAGQLHAQGIENVWQFMQIEAATLRRRWGVVLERTWRELHAWPCLGLEAPGAKQEIAHTRSFGSPVTALADLESAITEFSAHAARKLRAQNHRSAQVLVFVRTSPFRVQDQQYSRSHVCPLAAPTADTRVIVRAALAGLQRIYRPGIQYGKAGVMLLDLRPTSDQQQALDFGDCAPKNPQSAPLMDVLDALNARFEAGTLQLGTSLQGTQPWAMRQEKRSPHYTTRLSDIPVARCD